MAKKTLERSSSNRVIAGTVGGLGEYFGLSRTVINVIRVLIVLGTFGSWGTLLIDCESIDDTVTRLIQRL